MYGLIAASVACASAAYAVSLPALAQFRAAPSGALAAFLLLGEHDLLQGWGLLGLILLVSLLLVAWQVNRVVQRSLIQRFHNQALLERQEQARRDRGRLNRQLSSEVEQRRQADTSAVQDI